MTMSPVYLYWEGEIPLGAPVEKAWRHLIDYPSWQNFSLVQHVSGEVGQEGEVVRLQKAEANFTFPPYYARTIRLQPGHRVTWKVYLEERTPQTNFFGIVDFIVFPEAEQTRLAHRCLYEFWVPHETLEELESFRRRTYQEFDAVFAVTWPKLKTLVEG